MRDVDFPPDADHLDIDPDDPDEQARYLGMFRGRYAEQLVGRDAGEIEQEVHRALRLCPRLAVRHPRDVLRFLRLVILVLPALRRSPFLDRIVHRIITASEDWSATKRLDFIDKHVIERPLPSPEPDFGPWWDGLSTSM